MDTDLEQMLSEAARIVAAAENTAALEQTRVDWLGKSGRVTELLKTVGKLPVEQRKTRGAGINTLKNEIDARLQARAAELRGAVLAKRLVAERVDVTLPARAIPDGRIHPISQIGRAHV